MWDPQKYDRGISILWKNLSFFDHVWQPTYYMGSPCGTHKNIIVGFRWAPCVASHFLYGQPTWDLALCESPK